MKLRLLALALALSAVTSLSACSGSQGNSQTDPAAASSQPAPDPKADPKGEAVEEYAANGKVLPGRLPVVMDFNATWCGPCRQFGPVFHEVARKWKGKARFLSIDVDTNPATAAQYQVSSIPQITILMPDGTVKSTVGAMGQADFERLLKSVIK